MIKMKKIFPVLLTVLFVAAAVSCNKDDDKTDNPTSLGDNTLVYDGTTYSGTCQALGTYNGIHYELVGDGFVVSGQVESDAFNRTFNLTQHYTDLTFAIHINVGEILDLQYQNYPQNYWCFLNGDNLGSNSCFSSGTVTVSVADGKLNMVLEGTLINGKELKYKIVSAIQNEPEPDPDPYQDRVIVDGVAYPVNQTIARHNSQANMPYELFIAGEGDGSIGIRVEAEPATFDRDVDLTATNYAYLYRVIIYFWDQDTTATQSNFVVPFTGDVESSYWDIAAQTDYPQDGCIFTSGILRVYMDDDNIGFSLSNGTLTSGHSVSAQLRLPKSEIQEVDFKK